MGKRTSEKTDEQIQRKIRRLEREIFARSGRSPPPPAPAPFVPNEVRDGDSFHASLYNYHEELELDAYPVDEEASEEVMFDMPAPAPIPVDVIVHAQRSLPGDHAAEDYQNIQDPVQNVVRSVILPAATNLQTEEDAIPDEIMDVLGEAKKADETFGKKIPQGVSERLGKILVEGLAKEQKETLLTKTLIIPENFQLAKAPKLNAEVAAVLNKPAKNRDKRLKKLQNQLGSAIAGLVSLTTELINKDLDKMQIIKEISAANQLLLDLHHEETQSRRRLVIPMLDKNFINIIQNVKRDQFLFGDNLGDNIRTTKSIEKTSLQIKKPAPLQTSTSQNQSGNARGPVRQASAPGVARAQPSTSRFYPQPPPPAARRPPTVPRRQPPPPPPPPRGRTQYHRNNRR